MTSPEGEPTFSQGISGSYEVFSSLGILGNSRTKRFVKVFANPKDYSSLRFAHSLPDDAILVHLRIRQPGRGFLHDSHFLAVTPDDRIVHIDSARYLGIQQQNLEGKPTIEDILKEILAAKVVESKLKKRP